MVTLWYQEKLYQHPIHYISFCAEDKRAAPNATAYIARSTETPKRHMCFAFYANSDAQVMYKNTSCTCHSMIAWSPYSSRWIKALHVAVADQ